MSSESSSSSSNDKQPQKKKPTAAAAAAAAATAEQEEPKQQQQQQQQQQQEQQKKEENNKEEKEEKAEGNGGGAGSTPKPPQGLAFVDAVVFGAFGLCAWLTADFLLEFPDACAQVMRVASLDPRISEAVGLPMSHSLFWSGNVKAESHATVTIPVHGHKGKAVLFARLAYLPAPARRWRCLVLQASFDGSPKKFNLQLYDDDDGDDDYDVEAKT
jgi:hypothetical protein